MAQEPIDLVYTWVDDQFDGYLDMLNQYVSDTRDANPNRTRDNLNLLKYSMRSVERYLPQIRHIYLFSCRPQVPDWLDVDHPRIRVVHHDDVMPDDILPTFSSFAIVSYLHRLPGLSKQFIYFEDDMLANSPDILAGLLAADGRPIINLNKQAIVPKSKLNPATSSPWNLGLALADETLSRTFGPGPRKKMIHGPVILDRDVLALAEDIYPQEYAATRRARFRSGEGLPPEVLGPHYMLETGQAIAASKTAAHRMQGYASLENLYPWTWAQLKKIDIRKPLSITLNDSFEDNPNPRVERLVRGWLEQRLPDRSSFEKPVTN